MTRVELIANGEVVDGCSVDAETGQGTFRRTVDASTWLAVLVRGHYSDKPEIIAAHSSPVMIEVGGLPLYNGPDAMTILQQVEGALAYVARWDQAPDLFPTAEVVVLLIHNLVHFQRKKGTIFILLTYPNFFQFLKYFFF